MAKKTIFKSKFMQIDFINRMSDALKSASARELQTRSQQIINNEIKPLLDKGLSPVKGHRALAKYKNPKKYPADLKQSNKPNLKLSGEMLSNYKAISRGYSTDGISVTVGIHDNASQRSRLLRGVHNIGTKNIPMRPFIPKQSQGEVYTAKIMAAFKRTFRYIIKRALKGRGQK